MRNAALLAAFLLLGGCTTGHPPDPNDPKETPLTAISVNKQMTALNEGLFMRWRRNDYDEEEYKRLLAKGAKEIISNVELDAMDPSEIWLYGDVLRTAQQWEAAEEVLRIAVRHAKLTKNEDRRVNDSLRLAQAQAHLGRVKDAIATTRSTFDVRPEDAVPVLMGTLYEIVPAARGKGKDVEVARLLEDAIAVHMRAKVDPDSDAGRAFIIARPNHIRKAWDGVIDLYRSAKRDDLAAEASARAMESQRGFTSTMRA
ncbi:MAG: hypothetical protein ACO1SV_22060 [Fimbriimonas sp.]